MLSLIEKYYKGRNVLIYEESRKSSVKWKFESEIFEKIIRSLKNEINSIIDAPAGTGRFIPYYKKEFKGKTIYLLDYSDDMLKILKKRVGYLNRNKFIVLKKDLVNEEINVKADLLICFRFLNLINLEYVEKFIPNILNSTNKFALLTIRLIKNNKVKTIENGKVIIHSEIIFNDLIKANNFKIVEKFYFKDAKEGDYFVILIKREN